MYYREVDFLVDPNSRSPYDDELQLIQNEMEELQKIKDKATLEVEALFENQKVSARGAWTVASGIYIYIYAPWHNLLP